MAEIIELKNTRLAELQEQIREEIDQADGIIAPYILDMMAEARRLAEELRHAA